MMSFFKITVTLFFLFTFNVSNAQDGPTYAKSEFVLGYYFTKDGDKIRGLIEHVVKKSNLFNDPPFNSIKFKTVSEAPVQELTTSDIAGFILIESKNQVDSFTVIKNFVLSRIVSGKSTVEIPEDFAQVMQSGEITLYAYHYASRSIGFGGVMGDLAKDLYTAYFLKRKEENPITVVNKKNFKKSMMEFFKDCPPLVKAIDREQVKFKDMEYIVSQYNTWYDKNNSTQ